MGLASMPRAASVVGTQTCMGRLNRMAALLRHQDLPASTSERLMGGDPKLCAHAIEYLGDEVRDAQSIGQAHLWVGESKLRKAVMAVGFAMVRRDLAGKTSVDIEALDRQSFAIATTVESLTKHDPLRSGMAGLALNFGIGAMALIHGEAYKEAINVLIGGTAPLESVERMSFGYDHLALGYAWLCEAGFPSWITDRIPAGDSDLIMKVARVVSHQLGYDGGFGIGAPNLSPEMLHEVGLSEAKLGSLVDQISRGVEEYSIRLATLNN